LYDRLSASQPEKAVEFAGVLEPLVYDHREVGIGERVILEPEIVFEKVFDDAAKKGDVRFRPQRRRIYVAQRRSAREPWVDMDQCRALFLCLQCKAECDRMVLGHIGPHYEDPIRISQIPLR
jgi:hypothetical protein